MPAFLVPKAVLHGETFLSEKVYKNSFKLVLPYFVFLEIVLKCFMDFREIFFYVKEISTKSLSHEKTSKVSRRIV